MGRDDDLNALLLLLLLLAAAAADVWWDLVRSSTSVYLPGSLLTIKRKNHEPTFVLQTLFVILLYYEMLHYSDMILIYR